MSWGSKHSSSCSNGFITLFSTAFQYLVLKWTAAFRIVSQPEDRVKIWNGKNRIKTIWWHTVRQTAFELSATSLHPPDPPGLSVGLSGQHVFIHRLWGSCSLSTQCTNMQPAEHGFRGNLFSSSAGLSYIHGNQPAQSQHPVGQQSNKTQTELTMNQLLRCLRELLKL